MGESQAMRAGNVREQQETELTREAMSVSAAMALAKGALEGVTVRLVGEVSEVSDKPGYKAVYFTVKDEHAALPCLMWNNRYRKTDVELAVGQKVELSGQFTLYAARGTMNFNVFALSLVGEGYLRMRVAQIQRRLAAEGLTSDARKRPLPAYPETIGLVTSPRGDTVHDVLRTLRHRYPLACVKLAGVAVEGKDAPAGIMQGIDAVVAAGAEVVLIVRGGGSYENLMPFNDEALARAIAACPVPVVTGIGHEPDTTMADLVADVRASVPARAADAVSPSFADVYALLSMRGRAMHATLARRLELSSARLAALAARPSLSDASYALAPALQAVDFYADRLSRALPDALRRDEQRVLAMHLRFQHLLTAPFADHGRAMAALRARMAGAASDGLRDEHARLHLAGKRLAIAGPGLCDRFRAQMGVAAARLNDLSPLTVLARGYAIARDKNGAILKSVRHVARGSSVRVDISDGQLHCVVEDVRVVDSGFEKWEEEPCRK
ncbi:exodeoxyribonuclease VII large subunit [Adlercreutzia sp. ZJ138]|uniref:exodeoxyribonuclease VII large subunit n=1 Tax=Adlercreutzia sp. ZJ138 TaxID=2709405 RepID=UPI0013E9EFA4|nr:exodeoxyribonuclease VII large subunit [Adlercreutzia sp. ZJ138]